MAWTFKPKTKKYKITGSSKKAQILIYHTHSQEGFADTGGNKKKSIYLDYCLK